MPPAEPAPGAKPSAKQKAAAAQTAAPKAALPKGAAQKGTAQKETAQKETAPKAAAPKAAAAPPAAEPPKPKMVLQPHQVILRPLVTEKGIHRSSRHNAYAFEINRLATKDDVRRAIETLFEVKVVKVHTQNRKGKPRRSRFRQGMTKDWKKAIVKLDPEHRIAFF